MLPPVSDVLCVVPPVSDVCAVVSRERGRESSDEHQTIRKREGEERRIRVCVVGSEVNATCVSVNTCTCGVRSPIYRAAG